MPARTGSCAREIVSAVRGIDGVRLESVSDRTFLMHLGGKLEVNSKAPVTNRDQLSMAYTPGVARVCESIADDEDNAHRLTIKSNTVGVVSDGTAVLGLGDIGPKAAIPVMEGKAQLLKEFAGVDGFPICVDETDVDAFVDTVERIAPVFGAFEIEDELKERLDVPVFHDDQHGTAVVAVAALLNSLRLVDKNLEDLKVVMVGIGAAGTAVTHMLLEMGVSNIIGVDRKGAVHAGRDDLNEDKRSYAEKTNPNEEAGTLQDVMEGADVFIGLSGPDVLGVDDLKAMNRDPIVFAMANPRPEIMREVAYPHVAVMATGRSDYPNQINNVLCFPGLFKGVLACRATDVTDGMKIAAAHAIADTIDESSLTADYVVPSVFDKKVVRRVATAVKEAAIEDGVARKER